VDEAKELVDHALGPFTHFTTLSQTPGRPSSPALMPGQSSPLAAYTENPPSQAHIPTSAAKPSPHADSSANLKVRELELREWEMRQRDKEMLHERNMAILKAKFALQAQGKLPVDPRDFEISWDLSGLGSSSSCSRAGAQRQDEFPTGKPAANDDGLADDEYGAADNFNVGPYGVDSSEQLFKFP
jgi:hypothetical protein